MLILLYSHTYLTSTHVCQISKLVSLTLLEVPSAGMINGGKYKNSDNAVTVVWSIVAQCQSYITDYNQAARARIRSL